MNIRSKLLAAIDAATENISAEVKSLMPRQGALAASMRTNWRADWPIRCFQNGCNGHMIVSGTYPLRRCLQCGLAETEIGFAVLPRCPACNDVLPDGAAHCIACGAPTGNTGETTRLGSAGAPAVGETVRLKH